MPEMVLNRNYTVRSLSGRSVAFQKDKPVFVSPMLVSECAAVGATLADGTAPNILPEEVPAVTMPVDVTDRKTQYAAVFEKLAKRNARMDFGANGIPTVKAVEKLLGWEPHPKDMKQAWAAWREALLIEQEEAARK